MIEVRQTTRFATWLAGLRDERARARILKRLDRARDGNLGDVAPVGFGVSEMRIFYGPGSCCYVAATNRRSARISTKRWLWQRRLRDGEDRNDRVRLCGLPQ